MDSGDHATLGWTVTNVMCKWAYVLALIGSALNCQFALAQTQSDLPIVIESSIEPTPISGNGKIHLAYELHLTNFRARDFTLTGVEVLGGDDATPIINITGDELRECIQHPGRALDSTNICRISGGMRAIIFIWFSVENRTDVPDTLYHRLRFTYLNSAGETDQKYVSGFPVKVQSTAPLILGPPVGAGDWLLANGPARDGEHRMFVMVLDGKVRNAQRFAIDLMKFDEAGKLVHGDSAENENWHSYGKHIIAVADGIVSAVHDGVPDNIPLAPTRAVKMTRQDICGNYIILNLGTDRYAFYGHLQAGSLRVKNGDRVRRGQVLGQIGNSGNSDAPHLHFHVMDANRPLSAEGVPYAFGAFELLKVLTMEQIEQLLMGHESFPDRPDTPRSPRENEIPLGHGIVRFQ